jgi:hypothetical protein
MSPYDLFRSKVPEGRSGEWAVQRFDVSAQAAAIERIRSMFSTGGRGVREGSYTRLVRGGHLWMSDTHDEWRDHIGLYARARGHVLLNGLGLGCAARMCASKPEVESVTVIEIESDVIALVAPSLAAEFGDRLTVIEADAFKWEPPVGVRYGAVWHDIWPDICPDNLTQMHTLTRRYARRADWQGSWCRSQCERARR